MAFGYSSRLTSNILVVIGCLVAAHSGQDFTPVHMRTEIVSVMNIPPHAAPVLMAPLVQPLDEPGSPGATQVAVAVEPPAPAAPTIANTQGSAPVQVAAATSTQVAAASPSKAAARAPVELVDAALLKVAEPAPVKIVAAAPSALSVPAPTAAATRPVSRPASNRPNARSIVATSCEHGCRDGTPGTRAAKRKPSLQAARGESRHQARAETGDALRVQAPLPAVFVPIRNLGYFLQAKFTRPQEGCVAAADGRRSSYIKAKSPPACR